MSSSPPDRRRVSATATPPASSARWRSGAGAAPAPGRRSRAVRTPFSSSPSSTSVIATAGWIPTTTICAPSRRTPTAMSFSIRPRNESTVSTTDRSSSTPCRAACAPAARTASVWSARASRSCRSSRTVATSVSPMLDDRDARHYTSSSSSSSNDWAPVAAPRHDLQAEPSERKLQALGHRGPGGHAAEVDAEVDQRDRRARGEPDEQHLGAEQPRRGDRLQQVLGDGRVDDRHGGDVQDDDLGAGVDDLLEQRLVHLLGAGGVQAADDRQARGCRPRPGSRASAAR